jgi:Obg family GTPase CgtA
MSTLGQTYLCVKGGRGGRGNACFQTSRNRCPRVAENGLPGLEKVLTLELKLLADVGLVGLPSVGKSTMLSVVSSAKPEIADYPFTTIIPNLGVVYLNDQQSFVLADLPGLIEGASQGKGLGHTFLRHVERCKVLIHVLDIEHEDPLEDFRTINSELETYGFSLIKRPMIVAINKVEDDEAKENQGSENRGYDSMNSAFLLPGKGGAADPADSGSYGKPYEIIPSYHLVSSFLRLYPAVRAINIPALRISQSPILMTGYQLSLTHSRMLILLSVPCVLS